MPKSWFDSEYLPLGWFDPELRPLGWFDKEILLATGTYSNSAQDFQYGTIIAAQPEQDDIPSFPLPASFGGLFVEPDEEKIQFICNVVGSQEQQRGHAIVAESMAGEVASDQAPQGGSSSVRLGIESQATGSQEEQEGLIVGSLLLAGASSNTGQRGQDGVGRAAIISTVRAVSLQESQGGQVVAEMRDRVSEEDAAVLTLLIGMAA